MTDEQIAEFGYAHSDEHDEPLFSFDRAGFIACDLQHCKTWAWAAWQARAASPSLIKE